VLEATKGPPDGPPGYRRYPCGRDICRASASRIRIAHPQARSAAQKDLPIQRAALLDHGAGLRGFALADAYDVRVEVTAPRGIPVGRPRPNTIA